MRDQEAPTQRADRPAIPLIWRVVILLVAVGILGALLWQNLRRPPAPPAPAESAAEQQKAAAEQQEAATQVDPVPAAETKTESEEQPEPETTEAEARFQQGQEHYQARRWDEAIVAYQAAIDFDPSYQAAYVNLGDAYYQKGELDRAVTVYQAALDLNPNDAEVTYNLGAAYLQQELVDGQVDPAGVQRALDQIDQAVELDPKLPQPYYGRGAAYQLLGDVEQAITNFETFLALDDGSDQIATANATQILEQLKATQSP